MTLMRMRSTRKINRTSLLTLEMIPHKKGPPDRCFWILQRRAVLRGALETGFML